MDPKTQKQQQLFALLAALLQGDGGQSAAPQIDLGQQLRSVKAATNPEEQYSRENRVPGFEWNDPRGAFYNSPKLSPEARIASQGNTAANQWARLGALVGVNGDEVRRLNAAKAAAHVFIGAAPGTVTDVTTPTYLPAMLPTGNGASGMINPSATNPYADSNWWQATGRVLPPRTVTPARPRSAFSADLFGPSSPNLR